MNQGQESQRNLNSYNTISEIMNEGDLIYPNKLII